MPYPSCEVSYIYVLIEPQTNLIRYVGQSVEPSRRFYEHINDKRINYKTNWINKLKRLGYVPEQKVIFCGDKDTITKEENFWIQYYNESNSKLTNSRPADDTLGTAKLREIKLKDNGSIGVYLQPKTKRWVTHYKQKYVASFQSKEVAMKMYDCLARYYETHPVTNFPGTIFLSVEQVKKIARKIINKTMYKSSHAGIAWNDKVKRFRVFLLNKSSENIYIACFKDYDTALLYRDAAAKGLGIETVEHHEIEPKTIQEIREIASSLISRTRTTYSKYIGVSYSKKELRFVAFIEHNGFKYIGGFKLEEDAKRWHDIVAAYYGLPINEEPEFKCSVSEAKLRIKKEKTELGLIGVVKNKNRFVATIMLDRKDNYLGCFKTPEDAAYYADATRNFYGLTNNQTTQDKLSVEEAKLKIAQTKPPKGIRKTGTNYSVRINIDKVEYNFGGIPTKEDAIYISDALRNFYGLSNSGSTKDSLSREEVLSKYPK